MRSFIAIDLPNSLRKRIDSFIKGNFGPSYDATLKYVPAKNLHITLKFLGEISEVNLNHIAYKLRDIISNYEHFEVKINGVSGFPSKNAARVIFLKLDSPILFELGEHINHNFIDYGDNRKFLPHLTIARVKNGHRVKVPVIPYFDSFTVDLIKLKLSRLTPKGPIYSDYASFKLVR